MVPERTSLCTFASSDNDGWIYQPTYLSADTANDVFKLVKQYVEESSNKRELVGAINRHLKNQHHQSAFIVVILAIVMIVFPFLPFIGPMHPLPLIFAGLVPLVYGIYKIFIQAPSTFETLRGVGKLGL